MMQIMHKHRYVKHPEFNGLGEVVWEYLGGGGRTVSEISEVRDIKTQLAGIHLADSPVWHTKPMLDRYVEKRLGLSLADYGDDKGSNALYKAIAGEIRYFRLQGMLIDLYRTRQNRGTGVWRLADARRHEKAAKKMAGEQMHARNFYSSGAITTIYARTKQDYFRKILLKQHRRCLFCRFGLAGWMKGAHIVPYHIMRREDPHNAMNPANGLLLCATCDIAFENGSVTVQNDYGITIASRLRERREPVIRAWIDNIGSELYISKDAEYNPDAKYLEQKRSMLA